MGPSDGESVDTADPAGHFDHAPDIQLVVDPDGTIVRVNNAIQTVLGIDPASMEGDAWSDWVHPKDQEPLETAFSQVIDTTVVHRESVEYRHRAVRDSYCWVASTISSTATVNGHYVVSTRDITARKEQERELEARYAELAELGEELTDQYHYLLEMAPVMAIVTRHVADGAIIEDCNDHFLETLSYDADELIGSDLLALYTDSSKAELSKSGGISRPFERESGRKYRELVTKDGDVVEALLRAVPRRDPQLEVDGAIAFFIDISERIDIARERDRLEEFANFVSHDLRNPLNVAMSYTELVREEHESPHLERIQTAHERMETLITDLLTLARTGAEHSDLTPIDIGALTQSCWESIDHADATLCERPSGTIEADRTQFRQLLMNLFRNAVEHGGEDVNVWVRCIDDGFAVEDDGSGIAPERREQIFDSGYSTETGGTGLGLSIVREVAHAHEWTVDVEASEAGGARFLVTGVAFA